MKKQNYNDEKNYYDILGLTQDATEEEINSKYDQLYAEAINSKSGEELNNRLKELIEAKKVLTDKKTRKKYNKDRRIRVVQEEEANKPFSTGRAIIKIVGTSALVLAIIAFASQKAMNDVKAEVGKIPSIEETIPTATPTIEPTIVPTATPTVEPTVVPTATPTVEPTVAPTATPTIEPTVAPTATPTIEPTVAPTATPTVEPTIAPTATPTPEPTHNPKQLGANYFGDATDEKTITEKATNIANYLSTTNQINYQTGMPWTIEEIKNIIAYIGGAYVPANEGQALIMEDQYLNLICSFGNQCAINKGNWMMGITDITDDMIKEDIQTNPTINLTDNLLTGYSVSNEYLLWLQSNYNKMLTSTDRNECHTIYRNIIQSIADIEFGDGFTLTSPTTGNNIIITRDSLESKSRINDGNIYRLYGILIQLYGTGNPFEEFTVTSSTNGTFTVKLDTILKNMNVRCAEDLAKDFEYDNTGYYVFNGDSNLNNTWGRIQINTTSTAMENLYLGNTLKYEESQNLYLGK